MKKNRDITIDVVRGLAMITVVMGHSGFPYTDMIYLFHMPLFFIISGYLSAPKCQYTTKNDFGQKLWRRFKRLYIPYVFYTVLFTLLNNCFLNIGLYATTDQVANLGIPNVSTPSHFMSSTELISGVAKAFLVMGGAKMSGALWFLRLMLFASVLFEIERFVFRRYTNQLYILSGINLILFCVGVFISKKEVHFANLEGIFTIMLFYNIGQWLKIILGRVKDKLNWQMLIAMIAIALILLLYLTRIEHVNIGLNEFNNGATLLISSILGLALIYSISNLIVSYVKPLSSLISLIGKNTITILGVHFLAFKLVTIIVIAIHQHPIQYLASYPVLDGNWWLAYVIFGVFVPLGIGLLYEKYLKPYKPFSRL